MTESLPLTQKSISKSGIDTLSGLRNLSNIRSYFIGSISLMSRQKATNDPGPEPRPGPTGILFVLDHLTKSETIKK